MPTFTFEFVVGRKLIASRQVEAETLFCSHINWHLEEALKWANAKPGRKVGFMTKWDQLCKYQDMPSISFTVSEKVVDKHMAKTLEFDELVRLYADDGSLYKVSPDFITSRTEELEDGFHRFWVECAKKMAADIVSQS